MIYKLYITKYKGDERPDPERFNKFQNYYETNGVKVIGSWTNAEDPSESFLRPLTRMKITTENLSTRCKLMTPTKN